LVFRQRQNQEDPPISLERDASPPPAPVDEEAFARRTGEIIASASSHADLIASVKSLALTPASVDELPNV
jgi:hypothetical protein